MIQFKTNKITEEVDIVTGEIKDARSAKGLSLKQISKEIGIGQKYLEAIESGRWKKLPEGVYGKNFFREYAMFLGLDSEELLRIYNKEAEAARKDKVKDLFSKQRVRRMNFLAFPKIVKNSMIILGVIVCFAYLAYCLLSVTTPPKLTLSSPADNVVTSQKSIDFIGYTEPEAELIINGNPVLCDPTGLFNQKIDLKNGINTVTIIAKKKYGQETMVKKQILVKI
jgi:transcriptional regulator with XRE-family HTH domain